MGSSLLAISLALSLMAPIAAQEQPATTTKQGAGKDAPERLKITIRELDAVGAADDVKTLETRFAEPPLACRPGTYWWWQGQGATREGIAEQVAADEGGWVGHRPHR